MAKSHLGHFTAGNESRYALNRGPVRPRSHPDCLEKRKVSCPCVEWEIQNNNYSGFITVFYFEHRDPLLRGRELTDSRTTAAELGSYL